MPNHIYQRIKFSYHGEDESIIKKVIEHLKSEESDFDFNKIIPSPADMFTGNLGEKERLMCLEKGIDNWYDWQRKNWHTKWNAYGIETFQKGWTYVIDFQTAWNWPKPVIEKIFADFSVMFPGINIEYSAACEGGCFAVHAHNYDLIDTVMSLFNWYNDNDDNGMIRSALYMSLKTFN